MVNFFEVFKTVIKDWLESRWETLKSFEYTWEHTYPYMRGQIEAQKLLDAIEQYESRKPIGVSFGVWYRRMGELTYFYNPKFEDLYISFDDDNFWLEPELVADFIKEISRHVMACNLEDIIQNNCPVDVFVSALLRWKVRVQCDGAVVMFEIDSDDGNSVDHYWDIDISVGLGFLNNLTE